MIVCGGVRGGKFGMVFGMAEADYATVPKAFRTVLDDGETEIG